jgi:hypothetical protein
LWLHSGLIPIIQNDFFTSRSSLNDIHKDPFSKQVMVTLCPQQTVVPYLRISPLISVCVLML